MAESETKQKHPLAIAWDKWLASDEGQQCRTANTLAHNTNHYLENRLWRAFTAGANSSPPDATQLAELRRAAWMALNCLITSRKGFSEWREADDAIEQLCVALNQQETSDPQPTPERDADKIARAVRDDMNTCLRNAQDQSKPEDLRLMMQHFAEAGRQILEMIEERRYDSETLTCEGCGQPTTATKTTDDDVSLCLPCFAAVPSVNDICCPHCHWKPSPDLQPQNGHYKCGNCDLPFTARAALNPSHSQKER